jgi:hypothetical protein
MASVVAVALAQRSASSRGLRVLGSGSVAVLRDRRCTHVPSPVTVVARAGVASSQLTGAVVAQAERAADVDRARIPVVAARPWWVHPDVGSQPSSVQGSFVVAVGRLIVRADVGERAGIRACTGFRRRRSRLVRASGRVLTAVQRAGVLIVAVEHRPWERRRVRRTDRPRSSDSRLTRHAVPRAVDAPMAVVAGVDRADVVSSHCASEVQSPMICPYACRPRRAEHRRQEWEKRRRYVHAHGYPPHASAQPSPRIPLVSLYARGPCVKTNVPDGEGRGPAGRRGRGNANLDASDRKGAET